MEPRLKACHFQTTGRCNLACAFCGQHKGALSFSGGALTVSDWLKAAEDVRDSAAESGEKASIMLWGGEPLVYEGFDELAERLFLLGVKLSVVTNGTLIDRHAATLEKFFDVINVSFDGIGADDDLIRGRGTFEKASKNLGCLKNRRGRLTVLFTLSPHNIANADRAPELFAALGADELVFQPIIHLTRHEAEKYRDYSITHFECDYPGIEGYVHREDMREFDAAFRGLCARMLETEHPIPVRMTPHSEECACSMPWTRLHVSESGEAGFCTDFFGFSAGNIKDPGGIRGVFGSERAELFRKAVENGALSICSHCAWRGQTV